MARPVPITPAQLPPDQRPAPVPKKPCPRCGFKICRCLENRLADKMEEAGFPAPVRQQPYDCAGRKWRADFGFPYIRVAIEVEGGSWSGGGHVTGMGYEEDCIKYSEVAIAGWIVVRVTGAMVRDGRAVALIKKALVARGVRLGDGTAVYTRRYRAE